MTYATIRFVEAYGLWHGKRWAWMFGMASAGIYVPIEVFKLAERINWAGMAVFLTNALILIVLWRGRSM